jgi:uncharacterized repeat protein (TIGR03803 family)
MDQSGNLVGATSYGANTACNLDNGCGVVFRLAPGGAETVLYAFCSMKACKDGAVPGALITDGADNFYGVAQRGGEYGNCGSGGCGVIFGLTPQGTETVLYTFCSKTNCADGATPESVTLDDAGDFQGVTYVGGANINNSCYLGCGTVFQLAADGSESVLYSFCSQSNCTDGAYPEGSVMLDGTGNLYG